MASEAQNARVQADIIANAQATATRQFYVPTWFWLVAGLGMGFAAFAVATLNLPLCVAGVLTLTAGARLLSFGLVRSTGIRFRKMGGESASWLRLAYLVGEALAICVALGLDQALHSWWPGFVVGVIVFVGSLAFGIGHNWLLRHPDES